MHCCANWWQFLCNFQKSDQTSKEHKKKTLLEKNKENSLVICRTHQERWYHSSSPWQLEYYPMHSIVSRSCLLGCHVRAHQGIVSAPDPNKRKGQVQLLLWEFQQTITAQKEQEQMEKVVVFTNHQVIQAAADNLLLLVHVRESFVNVFCYKKADVCVLEVFMI